MAKATIKKVLNCDIKKVWDTIVDVENYNWRSDLSKTKKINENKFIEYTKDDYKTTFKITNLVPYNRLEFDIENTKIKGHWVGLFIDKEGKVEIEFTEEVKSKKILASPFVKIFLKKQQKNFMIDLENELRIKSYFK